MTGKKTGFSFWKTYDKINEVLVFIGKLMVLFQVLSVSFDVIWRYFFNHPIKGVTALNEWSLFFMAFLGFAWLQKRDGHVKIDMFVAKLKPSSKTLLTIGSLFLGVLVSIIFVWYGSVVTWIQWERGITDFYKIRQVPMALITVVLPLGSLLLLIQLARDIYKSWKDYVKLKFTREQT